MLDKRIQKIVLTGGPCAGKTKILAEMEKHLVEKGYYVITLSEVATQLIKSNMPPKMDKEHILFFQDIVLKTQIMKEATAQSYAEDILTDKKVIILLDRAIMDNRAYLETQEDFEYLLSKNGIDEQSTIYSYDFVIDLISTATAKKELYELDGIRDEPVERAAMLDKKTTLAWIDHPHMITVKPTEEIEEKVDIVNNAVDKFLSGVEFHNEQGQYSADVSLEEFNTNNSKVVDIFRTYLKGDLIVDHRIYRDISMFILGKYNDSFEKKIISPEEFISLTYTNPIVFTEKLREIYFTEAGDKYKVVENYDKVDFNFPRNNGDGNKRFVKIMN